MWYINSNIDKLNLGVMNRSPASDQHILELWEVPASAICGFFWSSFFFGYYRPRYHEACVKWNERLFGCRVEGALWLWKVARKRDEKKSENLDKRPQTFQKICLYSSCFFGCIKVLFPSSPTVCTSEQGSRACFWGYIGSHFGLFRMPGIKQKMFTFYLDFPWNWFLFMLCCRCDWRVSCWTGFNPGFSKNNQYNHYIFFDFPR